MPDRVGGHGGSTPLTCSTTCSVTFSGCDNCNEWFHGDCIRITEKMAKAIREWYCRECRGEAWAWAGQAGGFQEMKKSRNGRDRG